MNASQQTSAGAVRALRLSVLDQSPIAEGSTGAQALERTLDLARLADRLGYHRFWVAEHHGSPMLAGAAPEALIGPIAAATADIRVGSGGVMLHHYSPRKVAETFSVLAGCSAAGSISASAAAPTPMRSPPTRFNATGACPIPRTTRSSSPSWWPTSTLARHPIGASRD